MPNIEHAICVSASQAKILAKLDCCQGLCQGLCQRLCQDLRQGSPPNSYAKTYAKDYAKTYAKDRYSRSSQAGCLPRKMPRVLPRFVPRMISQIGVRLNMCQGFCQDLCQGLCQGLALKFFHVLLTYLSKWLYALIKSHVYFGGQECSSFPLAMYFSGSRWSRTSNDFFMNWQIIVGKFAIVLGLHSAGPI